MKSLKVTLGVVFHATEKRIRDFPIMPEKLIALTVTSGGNELAILHELT